MRITLATLLPPASLANAVDRVETALAGPGARIGCAPQFDRPGRCGVGTAGALYDDGRMPVAIARLAAAAAAHRTGLIRGGAARHIDAIGATAFAIDR